MRAEGEGLGLRALPVDVIVCVSLGVSCVPVYLPECPRYFRHCLHGRGFICNRIGFDAVTAFVYTAPVEFVIRTASF